MTFMRVCVPDGHILRHKARVRLFCLAFLSGTPTLEVGVNDRRRRGREVVGRRDIIPIKTEEWIRIEDWKLNALVDAEEFERSKVLRFVPLDACRFELMRFRVRPRPNVELPLQVRVQMSVVERHVEIRAEVLNDWIQTTIFIMCILLCGRPITHLARPSVPNGLIITRQRRTIEIGADVFQRTSKCSANFQLKRSKFKVTGRKTTQNWRYVYLLTDGRPIKRKRIRRRLQTRPTPLLGLIYCRRLNMRRSATADGRMSCRHSATTYFLVI